MSDTLKFQKVRDVKDPIADFSENAGIDVFVPEYSEEFEKDLLAKNTSGFFTINTTVKSDGSKENVISLKPFKDILIPSGLKVNIPHNKMCIQVMNKSGIATKKKLACGACLVDFSYMGECHIHLINTSDEPVEINFGQKIAQFVPLKIETPEIITTTDDIFGDRTSNRGSGGFGSTGV